jgi:predicted lysophospholipase L1 biosynthesis ABC-type transport system permease subunit
MATNSEHLDALTDIRSLMERSSRFISLSGLSGVFAGIFALTGAAAAYLYLDISLNSSRYYTYAENANGETNMNFFTFFFLDAAFVLIASILTGILLTVRKAKQKGQSVWDATAKRLLINLFIPLITGGVFCLALLKYSLVGLVAPATLIFYGLALINASKYTLHDIRYLGVCEIILGLTSMFYLGYGLIFWAIGFGVLHIIYGIVMYRKYEQ